MNTYFKTNKLKNNLDKTKFMIFSKSKLLKSRIIVLEDQVNENSTNIKILGMIINDNLDFSSHINDPKNGLYINIVRRKNAIMRISKHVGFKFAKTLSNSILISKLNYHLEIWGACTNDQTNKINKILIDVARYLNPKSIGHTDVWCLRNMNWTNHQTRYKIAIIKLTHKILNTDQGNQNYIYDILTMT